MTFQELIDVIRPLIHDVGPGQIWTDDQYAVFIDEATRYIYDQYPESRLTTAGTLATWAPVSLTNSSATLWIPDQYRSAIIEYVASRFYDTDSGDTRDQSLAGYHLKRFQALMGQKV